MVRGRKPKPLALHHLEGTFRPDRHGNAQRLEDRLTLLRLPPQHCALCRHEFEKDEWMAADEAETAAICLGCVAGAVIAFGAEVLDIVPREMIESYLADSAEVRG